MGEKQVKRTDDKQKDKITQRLNFPVSASLLEREGSDIKGLACIFIEDCIVTIMCQLFKVKGICGDSDIIVPYHENGKYHADKYKSILGFCEIIKAGCNHHPHGLEDCTPLIKFVEKYY